MRTQQEAGWSIYSAAGAAAFFALAFFGLAALAFLGFAAFGFFAAAAFFGLAAFGFFAAAGFFAAFLAFAALGFLTFLGFAALGFLTFFGFFAFSAFFVPRLNLPVAPVPLCCFSEPFLAAAFSDIFRWLLTVFSSLPTLKFLTMYLRMAWRDEPPRSFKPAMAWWIISEYLGWAAGFLGFEAFFLGLLVTAGAAAAVSAMFRIK